VPIETSQNHAARFALRVQRGSIHPQGWVPIETGSSLSVSTGTVNVTVAFTPKGGCPLKRGDAHAPQLGILRSVAFTPKGGCPLKRVRAAQSVVKLEFL